ncbi:MAG: hypothetical protein NT027_17555 [Proteobacteria bacterium]|nr:hypothetical protein [Pseudomonadota bacterium]
MAIVLHLLVIYPQKWISYILLAGLLARTVEAGIADTQGLWGKETKSQIFAECRWLRENFSTLPWRGSVSWRTPQEEYPVIDLCLGVPGQSLKAEFGVFRRSMAIPSECHQIAETKQLIMFQCKTDF